MKRDRQEVSGATIICQGEYVKLGVCIIDGVRISARKLHLCFSTVKETVCKCSTQEVLKLYCKVQILGEIDQFKYQHIHINM